MSSPVADGSSASKFTFCFDDFWAGSESGSIGATGGIGFGGTRSGSGGAGHASLLGPLGPYEKVGIYGTFGGGPVTLGGGASTTADPNATVTRSKS